MLLYIHGFNSSPLSEKARLAHDFIRQLKSHVNWCAPQLPTTPQKAIALLEQYVTQAIANKESIGFIGSSLGGYLATYLAEKYPSKAVLINPAVKPYELFADYLGEQINPYTNESYQVTTEHQAQLKLLDTQVIKHPDRFLLLAQTGDEVLDYRQAVAKYHCCAMQLETGGNHSYSNFADHLDDICRFLEIS